MGRACCVPQCKSGKKVPSHKFPKSPIRCLEWIRSLNLDHLKSMCADELQKFKVCYMHFREEDYYSPHPHYHRLLMNTAIPSLLVYNSNDSTDVKTKIENNVQQQPLQHFLIEDKQHNKVSQSVVTNMLFLQEQVHKQLSKQQVLLEICDEQQMEIKTEVPEVQQEINEKGTTEKNQLQQLHCEQKDNEKQENVIYNLEKRLQRVEEQLTIMATPVTNGSRRRSNLKHITRAKSLSPTARILYNTVVKLRRSNNRLKLLIKQEKQKHKNMKKNMKILKQAKLKVYSRNILLKNNNNIFSEK